MSKRFTRSASKMASNDETVGPNSSTNEPVTKKAKKNNVKIGKRSSPKQRGNQPSTSTKKASRIAGTSQQKPSDLLNVQTTSSSEASSFEPLSNETIIDSHKLKISQNNESVSSGEGHFCLNVGEELNGYKIIRRLGVGAYAAVWFAESKTDGSKVALKIGKCSPNTTECIRNESEMVKQISNATETDGDAGSNIVSFLDEFTVEGRNGAEYLVMVFEACGPNLVSIIAHSNQKKLSFKRIQDFSRQLLTGINFLHSNSKVLHCDLKPENIMIAVKDEDLQMIPDEQNKSMYNVDLLSDECNVLLKIGDFGFAMKSDAAKKMLVQTCTYRAPESFLRAKISKATDMWSLGCVIYYMATQRDLFKCEQHDADMEAETHLKQIFGFLGKPDLTIYEGRSKNSAINKLVESGKLSTLDVPLENPSLSLKNKLKEYSLMSPEAVELLSDLLLQMLQLDPKARLSAEQASNHPFFSHEEVDGPSEQTLRVINRSSSPAHEHLSPTYDAGSPMYNAGSPIYDAESPVYDATSPVYNPDSPDYHQESPTFD